MRAVVGSLQSGNELGGKRLKGSERVVWHARIVYAVTLNGDAGASSQAAAGEKRHFLLESGHHGDLWLDLESLGLQPRLVQEVAGELAEALSALSVDVVCDPLVEGAFIAMLGALRLNVQFVYAERFTRPIDVGLFPAGYRIPDSLRKELQGRRVAIVNDVIMPVRQCLGPSPIKNSEAR